MSGSMKGEIFLISCVTNFTADSDRLTRKNYQMHLRMYYIEMLRQTEFVYLAS
jgi:hypothetical protein